MLVYKLTDENGRTYGGTQWGPGVTHTTNGRGKLCRPGWLHYYEHPLLAVLHNPIHADFKTPRLWEAEAEGKTKRDGWMKAGCARLKTLREIPLPTVTTAQRVRYAIYCAKAVFDDPEWNKWADAWLSGADRPRYAAHAAAHAAANAAADAAYAACAADAACAARAAYAAACAACAAYAAYAAYAAADAANLNLAELAERAIADEPA